MSYVENNLMPNEKVIYKAKVHWFIFVQGILLFLLGIFLFSINKQGNTGPFGLMAIIASIASFISAIITRSSTELVVTSKRVIAKIGLISRKTVELNHSKVESINVDQSIFGRIFDFGTLVINGTGGGKTPIPSIDSPLEFRKNAMQAIDARQP